LPRLYKNSQTKQLHDIKYSMFLCPY